MAKVWVYAELSGGKLQTTALELMAKARGLGEVDAIALGTGAKAAAAVLGNHGAKVVHVNEDKAFDEFIAEHWERRPLVVSRDEPGYWETRGYHNHADPWKEERYG